MKTIFFLIITLVTTNAININIPDLGDVIGSTTQSAWSHRTIYQFLSIKYGMSPSGKRRFQPPEPEKLWKNAYDATIRRRKCPQLKIWTHAYDKNEDLEDCLTLDVFTPKIPFNSTNDVLLPVMVFIHGGGFIVGSSIEYRPNYLLEHDVLLVVLQYRLGPLGMLSLQTDAIPGNVGLLDQVLALQWINKHIKYFGGDNTQVTLFGQSAGASSISFHLISPIVEPHLFQKAIIQSGSLFANWCINRDPTKFPKMIFQMLTNITDDVDNSVIEEVLINAPLTKLYKTVERVLQNPENFIKYRLVIVLQEAGKIKYVTEDPKDIFNAGRHRTLPMIAGVTRNEGAFLIDAIYDMLSEFNLHNNDEYLRNNLTKLILDIAEMHDESGALVDIFNNDFFKNIFNKDKKLTFKDIVPGLTDILSVLAMKSQTLKQAKVNAKYEPQTFFYSFDYKGEYTNINPNFDRAVYHSDELIYLFPYGNMSLNAGDTKMAKLMCELWTSFAIHGQPTAQTIKEKWKPLKRGTDGPYIHLNSKPHVSEGFVSSEYFVSINRFQESLAN